MFFKRPGLFVHILIGYMNKKEKKYNSSRILQLPVVFLVFLYNHCRVASPYLNCLKWLFWLPNDLKLPFSSIKSLKLEIKVQFYNIWGNLFISHIYLKVARISLQGILRPTHTALSEFAHRSPSLETCK